ncbi:TRAPP subunit bet5 [Serendipita sp. 407]|nr:TRAPP subunit bet5 [Serendipita sp. 407]
MTIYSLYIFDRHCQCVYYHDWHRAHRPKPAVAGNILPGVSRAVSPQQATGPTQTDFTSPRNTLNYSSGIVVAVGEASPNQTPPPVPSKATLSPNPAPPMSKLPFDEEAKLVYGVIFSLRGMVQKLSGR